MPVSEKIIPSVLYRELSGSSHVLISPSSLRCKALGIPVHLYPSRLILLSGDAFQRHIAFHPGGFPGLMARRNESPFSRGDWKISLLSRLYDHIHHQYSFINRDRFFQIVHFSHFQCSLTMFCKIPCPGNPREFFPGQVQSRYPAPASSLISSGK
jgi:hypothetical protein